MAVQVFGGQENPDGIRQNILVSYRALESAVYVPALHSRGPTRCAITRSSTCAALFELASERGAARSQLPHSPANTCVRDLGSIDRERRKSLLPLCETDYLWRLSEGRSVPTIVNKPNRERHVRLGQEFGEIDTHTNHIRAAII